jgi:hypothetical protein
VDSEKHKLKLALTNAELADTIYQERLSSDHPHMAYVVNYIGLIHKEQEKC